MTTSRPHPQRWRVCPSVETFLAPEGDLYVLPAPDRPQAVIRAPFGEPAAWLLAALDAGASVDEALACCAAAAQARPTPPGAASPEPAELDMDAMAALVDALQQRGVLVPAGHLDGIAPRDEPTAQFDRQLRYAVQCGVPASQLQQRLAGSTVLVLGLGGVGGCVAECLARMGVGTIVGIDADDVAVENLPRQTLFTHADVGDSKAAAAERRLRSIVPDVAVTCHRVRIDGVPAAELLLRRHRPNLLINAADTPPHSLPEWVDEAAFTCGTPHVGGGQRLPFAMAGPLLVPGATACLRCIRAARQPADDGDVEAADRLARHLDEARASSGFVVPALGSADMLVAGMLVADAFALLTGAGDPALLGTEVTIDLRDLSSERSSAQVTSRCAACADQSARRAA